MELLKRHHSTDLAPRRLRTAPSRLTVPLAALLLGAAPCLAEGFAIGARAGSLGIGPEVTFGLGEAVHLRLSAAALDHGDTYTDTGIDYDADLELRNGAALLDWYPGGGGFRLTGGAVWNDSEVEATAPLEELLRREIPTLPPLGFDAGTLRGTVTVDPVGPYLGIGWGNPFRGGRWNVAFDLGAVYHGTPEVRLVADTTIPIGLIPGGREALDRELAEEEAALQEEVDDYTVLPVASVTISFAF